MITKQLLTRITVLFGVIAIGASCTTTYDAYGRPQSSLSPGGAAAIGVGAGLAGLLIGRNNPRSKFKSGGGGHHGHHGFHGGTHHHYHP